jgi:hypothetical protein
MVKIQGASSNHPMNRKPTQHPAKAPIQGSSANYMGKSASTSKTPSPANRPYPPTKPHPMNAGRGGGGGGMGGGGKGC